MSNVMNGALALAGDKAAALNAALADVCLAASRGWADGDVSIMVNTAKACKKTRMGKAVADVTQAFADIIRAQRAGQRIVLGEQAPAWRGQCYLPALPADLPEGIKGREFAKFLGAVGGWGESVAAVWGSAVDMHAAAEKAVADGKRADAKAIKTAAETAASAAVVVMNAVEPEKVQPDPATVNDLQAQVDALTVERDALRIGNAGLSAAVARLQAEVLALTPLPPEVVPQVAFSDLSVNARQQLAAAAAEGAAKAIRKGKRQPAVA